MQISAPIGGDGCVRCFGWRIHWRLLLTRPFACVPPSLLAALPPGELVFAEFNPLPLKPFAAQPCLELPTFDDALDEFYSKVWSFHVFHLCLEGRDSRRDESDAGRHGVDACATRVPCAVCRVPCVVCRVSCVVCRVSCVVYRVVPYGSPADRGPAGGHRAGGRRARRHVPAGQDPSGSGTPRAHTHTRHAAKQTHLSSSILVPLA
jgi:hypothetical protein